MTRPSIPASVPVGAGPPVDRPGQFRPAGLIRVLVVDDDARVRVAVGQTIALEADMELVGAAANAVTALALATSVRPSVALVDVLLPDERTGLSLVRGLCRQPQCAVVSMSVRSAVRDAALAAGATAFIEKGDGIDALLDSIRTAARSTT